MQIIPSNTHPTAIDSETGVAMVVPAHVIHNGFAYWLESFPSRNGPVIFLMARPALNGQVDWSHADDCEEAEDHPDAEKIIQLLTQQCPV